MSGDHWDRWSPVSGGMQGDPGGKWVSAEEAQEMYQQLAGLLDSARDFIAEGGLCGRMVGAMQLVNEIDHVLRGVRGDDDEDA